jgi:hypothetical protein
VAFRYNATDHAAPGMTPYRAVLGTEVFEFDRGLLQRWRVDDEPENLAQWLAEIHSHLLARRLKVRDEAALTYDRAVRLVEFAEGERVLVYDEAGAVAQGRKLRLPWFGPYRVERKLSDVSYVPCAKNDTRGARVHGNRMRRWDSNSEANARESEAGMWPDSRRMLRGILERRKKEGKLEYRVRHGEDMCGYRGWTCQKVVVNA